LPFDIRQSSRAETRPSEILRNCLLGAHYRSKSLLGLDRLTKTNARKGRLNPRYEAFDG
jgi:hypothetical protein